MQLSLKQITWIIFLRLDRLTSLTAYRPRIRTATVFRDSLLTTAGKLNLSCAKCPAKLRTAVHALDHRLGNVWIRSLDSCFESCSSNVLLLFLVFKHLIRYFVLGHFLSFVLVAGPGFEPGSPSLWGIVVLLWPLPSYKIVPLKAPSTSSKHLYCNFPPCTTGMLLTSSKWDSQVKTVR